MAIKRQYESDLSNPKERFAWALRGIEVRGMPMAFPEPILAEFSEHLSRTGAIHIDQVDMALDGVDKETAELILSRLPKQEIHYQPPVQGQEHELNVAGEWKPVDEPIITPKNKTIENLSPQEREKLIQELREEGEID